MKSKIHFKRKIGIGVAAGVAGIGAGVGVGVGILLPKANKAKEALENIISIGGGHSVQLSHLEKVNYVALGDSETAGYNGFMGKDYVSFADFFAKDLEHHNKLGEYKNFAMSGDTIYDMFDKTLYSPSTMHALQSANLVTITNGANDLMRFAQFLKIGFPTGSGFLGSDLITEFRKQISYLAGSGINTEEMWELIDQSIVQLTKAMHDNDFSGVIAIQKSLITKALDIIELNYRLYLRRVRDLAPNAQILVITHAFPFAEIEDKYPSVVTGHSPNLNGLNLKEYWGQFKSRISAATSTDAQVSFLEFDNLADYRDNHEPIVIDGITRERKMPNFGDIHPSTYGHELLGNGLFKHLAGYLGIKVDPSKLQHGKPEDGDGVPEVSERMTSGELIYQPEYFDESASPLLNRMRDQTVVNLLSNPRHDLVHTLLGMIDDLVNGLLTPAEDSTETFYIYDHDGNSLLNGETTAASSGGVLTGGTSLSGFFAFSKKPEPTQRALGRIGALLAIADEDTTPFDAQDPDGSSNMHEKLRNAFHKFAEENIIGSELVDLVRQTLAEMHKTNPQGIIKGSAKVIGIGLGTANEFKIEFGKTKGFEHVKDFHDFKVKAKLSNTITSITGTGWEETIGINNPWKDIRNMDPEVKNVPQGIYNDLMHGHVDKFFKFLDEVYMPYDKDKLRKEINAAFKTTDDAIASGARKYFPNAKSTIDKLAINMMSTGMSHDRAMDFLNTDKFGAGQFNLFLQQMGITFTASKRTTTDSEWNDIMSDPQRAAFMKGISKSNFDEVVQIYVAIVLSEVTSFKLAGDRDFMRFYELTNFANGSKYVEYQRLVVILRNVSIDVTSKNEESIKAILKNASTTNTGAILGDTTTLAAAAASLDAYWKEITGQSVATHP